MPRNTKRVLGFKQIRHLHGLLFEALCHRYTEQQLYQLLKNGETWYFWPEDVVMQVDFARNPEGEAKMIQLNEEYYLLYYSRR